MSELSGEIRLHRGVFKSLDAIEKSVVDRPSIALNELLQVLGLRSQLFLITFLMFPFLQPIPLPGLSTLIALVVAAFALSLIKQGEAWIPERYRNHHLSREQINKLCLLARRVFLKARKFTRPRGKWANKPRVQQFNAILMFVAALLLSLPIPLPASNFFPAAAIFCLSLGALEEDSAMVVVGYILFLISIAYFSALAFLPYFGYQLFSTPAIKL